MIFKICLISPYLAPPRPVVNVVASATSPTSIGISWDPPSHSQRTPGLVRGHRIFFTKAEDIISQTVYETKYGDNITNYVVREMALRNETVFDAGLTTYDIKGLQPYTNYCLWITVFTVADSPNSRAVCLLTDEDRESIKIYK